MTRPLRIEFKGALYHVTSRGDRKEAIYDDDVDRIIFLETLGDVVSDANWICHAYCLMGNHYHLIIETPYANLSRGMRQLNGVYTQRTNRRHQRVGHLLQGRYKAILVDRQAYLLELSRYVVLNPVRSGQVAAAGEWPWSSYQPMIGLAAGPSWFCADGLLAHFSANHCEAVQRFAEFVDQGCGNTSIWTQLNRQIYLGDDEFVARMIDRREKTPVADGIPRAQQRPPAPPLEDLAALYSNRNEAIIAAYSTGQYSYSQIARYYGIHYTSVGRVVRRGKQENTRGQV